MKVTLEEILEKLHSPTEHAITLENGELTALLEELKGLREENKVLISECDRLIKGKGELLKKSEQIAEYKRLLKAAVEDFETIESNLEYDEHCVIKTHSIRCDECPLSAATIYRCKWRYADEALKLIGGN